MHDRSGHCERWDAVVVGAGPAGAVASMMLARRGWRTLIVEKSAFGRTKCCGGCLNSRVLPLLDQLGVRDAVVSASTGRTVGVRLNMVDGAPVELAFSEPGFITPRTILDQSLLSAATDAGAETQFHTSAVVEDIRGGIAHLMLRRHGEERRVITPLVVGADGLNSAVARMAGMKRTRPIGRKFGVAWDQHHRLNDYSEPLWIEMFITSDGYLGATADALGTIHLAALINPATRARMRDPWVFLARMRNQFPELRRMAHDAQTEPQMTSAAGPMPSATISVGAEAVALVGDAAGYVEPFTGEGIACAIESAAVFGRVLESTRVGVFDARAAQRYRAMWRAQIRPVLRRCRMIAAAIEHPRAVAGVFRFAGIPAHFVEQYLARRITRFRISA